MEEKQGTTKSEGDMASTVSGMPGRRSSMGARWLPELGDTW